MANSFFLDKGKKSTRKISGLPEEKTCRCPEHNPPGMVVLEPGFYEHTCPSCGVVQNFTVGPKPTMSLGLLGICARPLEPRKGIYNTPNKDIRAKYLLPPVH